MNYFREDVSWDKASDKIPLELVRYLLGDLVQHCSTLVFLRGNRCLFLIDWPKVPNSAEAWTFHSLEHPKILYLPGSTPKKATSLPSQTTDKTPDLEEMNHQELVDLVKELLQERANRLSAPTPNKDPTAAGPKQSKPLYKV